MMYLLTVSYMNAHNTFETCVLLVHLHNIIIPSVLIALCYALVLEILLYIS